VRPTLTTATMGLALCGLVPQTAAAQPAAAPRLSPGDPSLLLGPVLVLTLALWLLALWAWWRRNNFRSAEAKPPVPPFPLLGLAVVVTAFLAYLYGAAVAQGTAVPLATLIDVPSPQAFLTAFLMFVTAYFLYLVVIETRQEPPRIDTHWGGFGGGLGGWTISRAIIYLIVAVVFGTLMMGHALWQPGRDTSAAANVSPPSPRPSTSTASSSSSSSTSKPAESNAAKPE
jgi:hypothetical protein